jgi:mono/diheme cytochrome c family protein
MLKILTLVTVAASLQLESAMAADIAHGQQLALRWCAGCHTVTSDAARATDVPPPFSSVAQRPGFDQNRLAFFLLNPHPVMPNMGLSRNDAADLAAYIASLRK